MEVNLKLTIENGEVIKAEVVKPEPKLDAGYSVYARVFDKTSIMWDHNGEVNRHFLKAQQSFANDLLKFNGHLFLNEVYDLLGMPRTKAGAIVGWIYNSENGDGYVDFGLDRPGAARFVNGYVSTVILDFNVDGPIADKI